MNSSLVAHLICKSLACLRNNFHMFNCLADMFSYICHV